MNIIHLAQKAPVWVAAAYSLAVCYYAGPEALKTLTTSPNETLTTYPGIVDTSVNEDITTIISTLTQTILNPTTIHSPTNILNPVTVTVTQTATKVIDKGTTRHFSVTNRTAEEHAKWACVFVETALGGIAKYVNVTDLRTWTEWVLYDPCKTSAVLKDLPPVPSLIPSGHPRDGNITNMTSTPLWPGITRPFYGFSNPMEGFRGRSYDWVTSAFELVKSKAFAAFESLKSMAFATFSWLDRAAHSATWDIYLWPVWYIIAGIRWIPGFIAHVKRLLFSHIPTAGYRDWIYILMCTAGYYFSYWIFGLIYLRVREGQGVLFNYVGEGQSTSWRDNFHQLLIMYIWRSVLLRLARSLLGRDKEDDNVAQFLSLLYFSIRRRNRFTPTDEAEERPPQSPREPEGPETVTPGSPDTTTTSNGIDDAGSGNSGSRSDGSTAPGGGTSPAKPHPPSGPSSDSPKSGDTTNSPSLPQGPSKPSSDPRKSDDTTNPPSPPQGPGGPSPDSTKSDDTTDSPSPPKGPQVSDDAIARALARFEEWKEYQQSRGETSDDTQGSSGSSSDLSKSDDTPDPPSPPQGPKVSNGPLARALARFEAMRKDQQARDEAEKAAQEDKEKVEREAREAKEKEDAQREAEEAAEKARIAQEKADAERLAAEKLASEKLAAEKAATEAAEKAAAEKLAAEKAAELKAAAEKLAAKEKAAEKKAAEEKAAEEKAAEEKAAEEKAAEEKAAENERIRREKEAADKARIEEEKAAAEKAAEDERIRKEEAEAEAQNQQQAEKQRLSYIARVKANEEARKQQVERENQELLGSVDTAQPRQQPIHGRNSTSGKRNALLGGGSKLRQQERQAAADLARLIPQISIPSDQMQKDGEDKPSKANDSDDNCDDSETSNDLEDQRKKAAVEAHQQASPQEETPDPTPSSESVDTAGTGEATRTGENAASGTGEPIAPTTGNPSTFPSKPKHVFGVVSGGRISPITLGPFLPTLPATPAQDPIVENPLGDKGLKGTGEPDGGHDTDMDSDDKEDRCDTHMADVKSHLSDDGDEHADKTEMEVDKAEPDQFPPGQQPLPAGGFSVDRSSLTSSPSQPPSNKQPVWGVDKMGLLRGIHFGTPPQKAVRNPGFVFPTPSLPGTPTFGGFGLPFSTKAGHTQSGGTVTPLPINSGAQSNANFAAFGIPQFGGSHHPNPFATNNPDTISSTNPFGGAQSTQVPAFGTIFNLGGNPAARQQSSGGPTGTDADVEMGNDTETLVPQPAPNNAPQEDDWMRRAREKEQQDRAAVEAADQETASQRAAQNANLADIIAFIQADKAKNQAAQQKLAPNEDAEGKDLSGEYDTAMRVVNTNGGTPGAHATTTAAEEAAAIQRVLEAEREAAAAEEKAAEKAREERLAAMMRKMDEAAKANQKAGEWVAEVTKGSKKAGLKPPPRLINPAAGEISEDEVDFSDGSFGGNDDDGEHDEAGDGDHQSLGNNEDTNDDWDDEDDESDDESKFDDVYNGTPFADPVVPGRKIAIPKGRPPKN